MRVRQLDRINVPKPRCMSVLTRPLKCFKFPAVYVLVTGNTAAPPHRFLSRFDHAEIVLQEYEIRCCNLSRESGMERKLLVYSSTPCWNNEFHDMAIIGYCHQPNHINNVCILFAGTKEKYKISFPARLRPKITVMRPTPPESSTKTGQTDCHDRHPPTRTIDSSMRHGAEGSHPPWR